MLDVCATSNTLSIRLNVRLWRHLLDNDLLLLKDHWRRTRLQLRYWLKSYSAHNTASLTAQSTCSKTDTYDILTFTPLSGQIGRWMHNLWSCSLWLYATIIIFVYNNKKIIIIIIIFCGCPSVRPSVYLFVRSSAIKLINMIF